MKNIVNIEEHCKFIDIHGNSWTLKFDNFSKFQYVIRDTPSLTPERHYDALRTKKDMCLTPKATTVFNC